MKRLQLVYKSQKRLQLIYKNRKNLKESKESKRIESIKRMQWVVSQMQCVSQVHWITFVPRITCSFLITCPISSLSLARFHPSSEVMSCEQFPPHPAVYKANWACQNQNNYEATS